MQAEKIQRVKELTPQEVHNMLLPLLAIGAPLLPDDIALIQARAATLMEKNPTWTVEATILSAATERFQSRESIAVSDPTATVSSDGPVLDVVLSAELPKTIMKASEEPQNK